jgi:hypothetical protein
MYAIFSFKILFLSSFAQHISRICKKLPSKSGKCKPAAFQRVPCKSEYVPTGGSARHLYVVGIYSAICLQIKKFCSRSCNFSPGSKISILLYDVAKLMVVSLLRRDIEYNSAKRLFIHVMK